MGNSTLKVLNFNVSKVNRLGDTKVIRSNKNEINENTGHSNGYKIYDACLSDLIVCS